MLVIWHLLSAHCFFYAPCYKLIMCTAGGYRFSDEIMLVSQKIKLKSEKTICFTLWQPCVRIFFFVSFLMLKQPAFTKNFRPISRNCPSHFYTKIFRPNAIKLIHSLTSFITYLFPLPATQLPQHLQKKKNTNIIWILIWFSFLVEEPGHITTTTYDCQDFFV